MLFPICPPGPFSHLSQAPSVDPPLCHLSPLPRTWQGSLPPGCSWEGGGGGCASSTCPVSLTLEGMWKEVAQRVGLSNSRLGLSKWPRNRTRKDPEILGETRKAAMADTQPALAHPCLCAVCVIFTSSRQGLCSPPFCR